MTRGWLALPLSLAAGAVVACATAAGPASVIPVEKVTTMMQTWKGALTRGAIADPVTRFPNPSRADLLARLKAAATPHGYSVTVTMLHPRQDAPLIVAQFRPTWPVDLDEAVPANRSVFVSILLALRSEIGGQLYEGFFVEALNANGAPLYARYSASRAQVSRSWIRCGPTAGIHCGWSLPDFNDPPLCKKGQTSTKARPCT